MRQKAEGTVTRSREVRLPHGRLENFWSLTCELLLALPSSHLPLPSNPSQAGVTFELLSACRVAVLWARLQRAFFGQLQRLMLTYTRTQSGGLTSPGHLFSITSSFIPVSCHPPQLTASDFASPLLTESRCAAVRHLLPAQQYKSHLPATQLESRSAPPPTDHRRLCILKTHRHHRQPRTTQ